LETKGFEWMLEDGAESLETLTKIWDQQYVVHPTWSKGPYELSPIMERLASGARLLDIGCGSGRYLVPLVRNGFDAVGADLSRQALESLGPRYARVVADVRRLPFSDHRFDAVTCYGVLQHLTRIGCTKAIAEIFRILKRQGLAFIEVTGFRDMRSPRETQKNAYSVIRGGIPHHYFSPAELRELVETAEFEVLTVNEKITRKQYAGVVSKRHRIFLVACTCV
jgi:ubiquinone/menaquinone biosynthesis C-methylase UbiE